MADMKLNELEFATDADKFYAESSSGNQVRISRQTLINIAASTTVAEATAAKNAATASAASAASAASRVANAEKAAVDAVEAMETTNTLLGTLQTAIGNLGTSQKDTVQIGKNTANFGCEEFSTTGTYFAGMHCIYQGSIYKFTGTKQAGAWDASKAALSSIHELVQSNYVQKNDYVPGLTAGSALGLVGKGTGTSITVGTGGRTVPDTIGKGVSAKVTKIEGRSVAWRQMAGTTNIIDNNCTHTINDDGSVHVNSNGNTYSYIFIEESMNGHKVLTCSKINCAEQCNAFFSDGTKEKNYSLPSGWSDIVDIMTTNTGANRLCVGVKNKSYDVVMRFLDLTLTFGSAIADTITSADDVANLLGFDTWQKYTESAQFETDMVYKAEGELIPTRPQALRSEGVTATGETFSISRELSDAIAQCFPDGMRWLPKVVSGENVCDKFIVENGQVKAVQNVGERAYQSGDESNADLLTNNVKTYYPLTTPVVTELEATSLDLALLSGGGTLTLVPQTGQRTAPLKATMNVSRDYVTLIEECAKKLYLWDA